MMLPLSLLRLTPSALHSEARARRLRRLLEGVTLWLAFGLLLMVQPLYAEAAGTGDLGSLELVAPSGGARVSALALDSRFDVTVSGLIASTRLVRRFRNPSDQWREGVFVFPLPEKASVYGLVMTVGERRIEGKVLPRAEARRTYDTAKQAGQQAATVDQDRPNLFTSRVANLPPGGEVTIELSYQQPVAYRQGVFELDLPSTLTPRYMPGPPLAQASPADWRSGWALATALVPDAGAISPFTVTPADLADGSHRMAINVTLNTGLPLASVASPSHPISVQDTANGVQVALSPSTDDADGHRPTTVRMDRDFVLRWAPAAGQAPVAAVFHERFEGEDYLMTLLVPGQASEAALPRDLVFVIDTSGSMAGASIREARLALARGLGTLGHDDRFNIIQFNSQAEALFMAPVPADGNHLARARRYLAGLTADGGTEMASALSLALGDGSERNDAPARVRQVVFITDGAVGNEAGLFQQIRRQLGSQRLFTVGIGSAPNRYFLREAARWGRGSYTSVADSGDLGGPLDALFASMAAPVLTDIRTDWPGTAEAYPARPGDLFQGEPLVQVVRGVPARGQLTVSGLTTRGTAWSRTLDLGQAAPATGLHRRWARARIDDLQDQAALSGTEPDKATITALAMRHSLASPYTSFVAVDTTPSRPVEAPLMADSVPTLLPAGSTPGMLRYPGTATGWPLMVLAGTVGAVLMGFWWSVLARRRVAV